MRWHLVRAVFYAALLSSSAKAAGSSWVFRPSYYSHNPASGERAIQYAPEDPAYFRIDPTYQQSAYRHVQDTIAVGDSSDHLHIVETWGRGEEIRPYGEWLFPYRPGATPYGSWPYGYSRFGAWGKGPWGNPLGFGSSGMVQGPGMVLPGWWWGDLYGRAEESGTPVPWGDGPRPTPFPPPSPGKTGVAGQENGSGAMPSGGLPNGTTPPQRGF